MAVERCGIVGEGTENPNPSVTDLLNRLNLTEQEEAIVNFSDDQVEETALQLEWVLVGKVLSP